jgi:hypothetical protein
VTELCECAQHDVDGCAAADVDEGQAVVAVEQGRVVLEVGMWVTPGTSIGTEFSGGVAVTSAGR